MSKYKLKRSNGAALYSIEPWEPRLAPLLTYVLREMDPQARGRRGGYKFTTQELYSASPDHASGVFPAGLFQKVVRTLKAWGHTWTVEDYRDLKALMPVPDFTQVEALRPGQEQVLLAVASSDGGLLVGGTGIGKSFLINQICRMYPQLKIVIASPRVSVVDTLADNLRKSLGPAVAGKIGGGADERGRRVTVVTAKSLLKAPVAECDLLLFDEVHAVGGNKLGNELACVARARKFGFTATPTGRGDNAELVIEALFGPVLVDIPYTDAVGAGLVTPIEVHKYAVRQAAPFNTEGPMYARKRHGYWRNKKRNEAIACVARGFPPDEQVLIMTETLEHAIALHQLLPEYKVVHYGGSGGKKVLAGVATDKYKLNEKLSAWLRREFSAGRLKKVISTTVWAEGVFRRMAPRAGDGTVQMLLIAGTSP